MNTTIRCAVWNVCSLNNKVNKVMEHFVDQDCDVSFITETWLTTERNIVTADIKNYGYVLKHNIRDIPDKERGGGVGVAVKSCFSIKQDVSKPYQSFEHTVTRLACSKNRKLSLISIYRLQHISVSIFLEEFEVLLEEHTTLNDDFIIAGDINIHVETNESPSVKFHDLMDCFDLKQHIVGPTHIMGHTIDVVITRNKTNLVKNVTVTPSDLSHHSLITYDFTIEPLKTISKSITYRATKNMDRERFQSDLTDRLSIVTGEDLGERVHQFNTILSQTLDEYAPMKTREIRIVPHAPWFDEEYATLRRTRRRAEKKFRISGLEEDKAEWKRISKDCDSMASEKKKTFIINKLDADNSSKNLHKVVNTLLDNNKETVLPSAESDLDLANEFATFFREKVEKIRASIPAVKKPSNTSSLPPDFMYLDHFEPATLDELRKLVLSYGVKCSPEDPLPASVTKENIELLLPFWLELVNLSLETGSLNGLKNAVILPLIKELGALVDKDKFKNYRPVSNLQFLSKLIERVVDSRIQEHLARNNLNSDRQFGCKKFHSTETLLIKIVDNLLMACDKNLASVVILLDLSAAFDTVDHKKLLHLLQFEYGIRGVALKWFKSFLIGRSFNIKIGKSFSDREELMYGVPQGSVLGPRLFNMYSKPIFEHVEPSSFEIEGYVDDHQLIKQFLPLLQGYALGESIVKCLNAVHVWMNEYFLRLNPDKTKILVVAPPAILKEIMIGGVLLNQSCIRFVDSAKNLGVVIDSVLSFEPHVNKLVKSCFLKVRQLYSVSHLLTQDQLKSLVCCKIFSSLDYCNSLFYGLNEATLRKLQHVQNSAARLVIRRGAPVSLNTFFLDAHWLRIRERVIYKIILMVHNSLLFRSPASVRKLVPYADSERTMKLKETRVNNRFGVRAFSHAAPKIWNLLPPDLRSESKTDTFKKLLKSYLMTNGDELQRRIKMI